MATFTQTELESAFHAVADPDDWKKAIKAKVALDKLTITMVAVEYFTGTIPVVKQIPAKLVKGADGQYQTEYDGFEIEAVGYRMGPAGP